MEQDQYLYDCPICEPTGRGMPCESHEQDAEQEALTQDTSNSEPTMSTECMLLALDKMQEQVQELIRQEPRDFMPLLDAANFLRMAAFRLKEVAAAAP